MRLGLLRILGACLALSLMIGDIIRTWGAGRHILSILDDFFMGGLLLAGALLMARPTNTRWAIFVAGWASCAGMLYGSFFGKVIDPAASNAGNFDIGVLTALIGVAFATSLLGLTGTIFWKPQP